MEKWRVEARDAPTYSELRAENEQFRGKLAEALGREMVLRAALNRVSETLKSPPTDLHSAVYSCWKLIDAELADEEKG